MEAKLEIVMFPWIAYGHFIPFLHLSNQLAERGHSISFILPKSAQMKIEQLNQYPDLIKFYPLVIPQVDSLPSGAETNSDISLFQLKYLMAAFDQTQPQIESYLRDLRPGYVIYDFAYWIPNMGRTQFDFKSICYMTTSVVVTAFLGIPSRLVGNSRSTVVEELLLQPPPGFPSSGFHLKPHELTLAFPLLEGFGEGSSVLERMGRSRVESDAIAYRACYEIEGSFCDYVADSYKKPVLVTGLSLQHETVGSSHLDAKWANWLNKFEAGSVLYCAFGSQVKLQKEQLQELVLGFELTGLPFLAALAPPDGYSTVEEALPEGFRERVGDRGWVYGGWVPQTGILQHPSVGCFVSHCGHSSMLESLLLTASNNCQIVLIPQSFEQIMAAKLMVYYLKVAAEVEREECSMLVSKENLRKTINLVMDKGSVFGAEMKSNREKMRSILLQKDLQENYINNFIQGLQALY